MNERERLIELIVKNGCEEYGGNAMCDGNCFDRCDDCITAMTIGELADRLLANGVIVPPVSVGQTVYCYCGDFGVILPYFVGNMAIGFIGKDRENYVAFEANCHSEETDELLDEIDFDIDEIGKAVFLTREEAEKALAERSKDDSR